MEGNAKPKLNALNLKPGALFKCEVKKVGVANLVEGDV